MSIKINEKEIVHDQTIYYEEINGVKYIPYDYTKSPGFSCDQNEWLTVVNEQKIDCMQLLRETQKLFFQKSLNHLIEYNTVNLSTPVGFGLTFMISLLWYELKYMGIFIVNTEYEKHILIDQLNELFPEFIIFNTRNHYSGVIPHIIISTLRDIKSIPFEIKQKIGTLVLKYHVTKISKEKLLLEITPKYIINTCISSNKFIPMIV